FQIPEKAGGWVAYLTEPKKESKEKPAPKAEGDSIKKEEKPKPKKTKKNSDDNGYTLVLKSLSSGNTTEFVYVTDYAFAKFGQGLLFRSTGNDSTMTAGVYWYDISAQKLEQIFEGHS